MDEREVSIMTQTAFKGAVELVKVDMGLRSEQEVDWEANVEFLTSKFFEHMASIVDEHAVQTAFPGTQPMPLQQPGLGGPGLAAQGVQPNVAPLAPVAAPMAGPAQIPQAGYGGFDKFQDFRQNGLNSWNDNRAKKKSSKSPDFIHKSMADPANPQYKVSIYLNNDDTPLDIKQMCGVA